MCIYLLIFREEGSLQKYWELRKADKKQSVKHKNKDEDDEPNEPPRYSKEEKHSMKQV
jgi:hypothetical protein